MRRCSLFKIDAFTPTIYWSLCASVVIAHWYRWLQIGLFREQPEAKCTCVTYFLLTIEEAKHIIFSYFTSQYLDQFFLWVNVTLRPGSLQSCKVHDDLDNNFCPRCTLVFLTDREGFWLDTGTHQRMGALTLFFRMKWCITPVSENLESAKLVKIHPNIHTAALAGNRNVTRAAVVPSASPHPCGHLSIILPVSHWKIRQIRLWWNWVRLYETASAFKHEGGLHLWYAERKPCKI